MLRTATMALVSLVLIGCLGCSKSDSSAPLTIATAASLSGAFKTVAAEYTKQTGTKISLVIASSGKLTQQIQQGAPYDIFASANTLYTQQLIDAGEAVADTMSSYAVGRLALWVKSGDAPPSLNSLTSSAFEHVAIANPKHAPYGMASKQALEKQGLWKPISDKLVRGSNVRQAMQFVESGNAEVALIAHSLALHGGGAFTLVDPSLHDPLTQSIVVLTRSKRKPDATRFIEFLSSETGRRLLRPYGLEATTN